MAKKLDLSPLDDYFAKGEDFKLTAAQYKERVGKPLPSTATGIKREGAPLARKAKEQPLILPTSS